MQRKVTELSRSLAKVRTRARERAKRLTETREILAAALDALQEGILVIDNEMNVLVLNRYMRELFKIKGDFYKKKCPEVIQGSLIPCRAISCKKVMKTQKSIEEELVLLIDGEKRIFEVRTSPWALGENLKGVIRTFTDITHRRAIEELSILTGISKYMSHTVRNALMPIGGFLKLISIHLKGDEATRSYYRMVEESLNELEEAVDEYADFIKVKGEEAHYAFDMLEVIRTLPEAINTEEAERLGLKKLLEHANIFFNIQSGSFIKFGNERLFLRALLYLIKGALQACKEFCEGKGKLKVGAEVSDEELLLKVVLEGAEVPDSVLVTMYRPWEEYGVEPAFHHWGVAIFNEVAKKHSGSLIVKREKGSTLFLSTFPKDSYT